MADLKLKLTATEYDQPATDELPVIPGQLLTQRIRQGEEFTARSQEEYDRLVASGAAVPADAPDPADASSYKGAALDEALDSRGLSTDGRADEKRERLQAALDAENA